VTILSIETSCDETAAAVTSGLEILSSVVFSQEAHKKTFGVVPEVASRLHLKSILPVLDRALFLAFQKRNKWAFGKGRAFLSQIDAIAVTDRPGLLGSLLVGTETANALALLLKKPLIAVNHYLGHIYSFLPSVCRPQFPTVVLTVSGGHTSLYLLKDLYTLERLGKTRDDAAGEAFDKAAAILGLGYPGGPLIEELAKKGEPQKFSLPRPMEKDASLDFSFSGLKTALLYLTEELPSLNIQTKAHLAASFQKAVADTLALKTLKAIRKTQARGVALVGGVASNKTVQEKIARIAKEAAVGFYLAPAGLRTDNAAMIGIAAGILLEKEGLPQKMNFVQASAKIE